VANSKNAQALEDSTKARWPGVVVYDIGDKAHQGETSDHNPDDTPGVRAEQSDSDLLREVRATDTMIGPKFTKDDAADLFEMLTRRPENQARMSYVIYNRRIRSRKDGWKDRAYTGSDPHTNHVHGSTWAGADNNSAPFNLGAKGGLMTKQDDALNAILTGEGSKTFGAANNLHVKLNEILQNAKAASLRADALLNMADVITSWSGKNPTGVQINRLAAKLNGVDVPDVDEDALATALAGKLSEMLPEGVGLTKDDVRDALVDVLTRGTDAPTDQ
jgi:hypothetical protein